VTISAIGIGALVYLNFGTIKLHWTEVRPGTVIRLAGNSEPYATVIRFDPSHQFAVGEPARAYQLKLSGSDEVIWLSERIVEKGMVPAK
jgi:hypothetical protein